MVAAFVAVNMPTGHSVSTAMSHLQAHVHKSMKILSPLAAAFGYGDLVDAYNKVTKKYTYQELATSYKLAEKYAGGQLFEAV